MALWKHKMYKKHFCKCLSGGSVQCQHLNFTKSLFQKELNNFCNGLSDLFSLKSLNFSIDILAPCWYIITLWRVSLWCVYHFKWWLKTVKVCDKWHLSGSILERKEQEKNDWNSYSWDGAIYTRACVCIDR